MTTTLEKPVKESGSKIEPSVLTENEKVALNYARQCNLSLKEAAGLAGVRRVDVFNYWSDNIMDVKRK